MPEIDVLKVLDEMDKFRREHQDEKISPPDWCMRVLEAILAKEAGFKGRAEWTDTLKSNPDTFYSKEYDPQLGFHK